MSHYIFITGGVLSGLGKGITAASIGATLIARGLKVTIQKLDPYLNVDAGMLNPAEHGECFVTKDGAETDLDLGHYERFLDIETTQLSSVMSGKLFRQLIVDERRGKFKGQTVQLVPHFTNAIQDVILAAGQNSDVHIVELGGTVGDMEGLAFVEAFREFSAKVGRENCIFGHVVYIPYLGTSKEFKTKPAQNAVRDLRGIGIMPDILFARTEKPISDGIVAKLSMFAGLPQDSVILLPNAATVYSVPLTLESNNVSDLILERLGIEAPKAQMQNWEKLVKAATQKHAQTVKIGIVAKYLSNEDTYLCVVEAIKAAAWQRLVGVDLTWVDAERLEKNGCAELSVFDAIVVPGGFGSRGVEGKIAAAGFAMENNLPYLGLCLGLQTAVIAATRKAGVVNATTEELDNNSTANVIYIMADQKGKESTGGTMRLGDYPANLIQNSLAAKIYGSTSITERHRHRYEVNQKFAKDYQQSGLVVSGSSPDGRLVEMVELPGHPFFVATQAHPEFKSRPNRPHPLFLSLIDAALKKSS